VVGLRKRFKADKLQRSYDSFVNQFGFTKRQVKEALKYLKKVGIIDLDFRHITTQDGRLIPNVLFIGLDPLALQAITHSCNISYEKTSDTPPKDVTYPPQKCQTNTETTTETTTEDQNIPPTAENFSPPISEKGLEDKNALSHGSIPARISNRILPQEEKVADGSSRPDNHGSPDNAGLVGSDAVAGTVGEEKVDVAPIQESPSETKSVDPLLVNRRPDLFDLAIRTEEAQAAEGSWTVPAEAGGDDPWADGPVDAFCTVLAEIPPLLLADDKRRDWARKLAQIGEEWNRPPEFIVTPALMIKAIKAVPDDAKIGWKTYTNPFAGNFAHDIGPLLLNGGRPTNRKEKTHETRKRAIAPNAAKRRIATPEEAAAILANRGRVSPM